MFDDVLGDALAGGLAGNVFVAAAGDENERAVGVGLPDGLEQENPVPSPSW